MMRHIHAWLKERRDRRERDEFERGYGYVMTERYLNKVPLEYLEDTTYDTADATAQISWNNPAALSQFQLGVREALRFIGRAEVHAKARADEIKRLRNKPVAPGKLRHPPIPSPV